MNNRHHILFDRRSWELRAESKYLREQPSLIPLMDMDIHSELHQNCPPVPMLGYYALNSIVSNFHPHSNTLISMDRLMGAMEQSTRHKNTHPIERELAALAIEAVELQRYFIKDGYID